MVELAGGVDMGLVGSDGAEDIVLAGTDGVEAWVCFWVLVYIPIVPIIATAIIVITLRLIMALV